MLYVCTNRYKYISTRIYAYIRMYKYRSRLQTRNLKTRVENNFKQTLKPIESQNDKIPATGIHLNLTPE